jgi:hypothetical protein
VRNGVVRFGLFAQFSLGCLNGRLSLLDSASDYMPVVTAFGRSMNEQNFAPDTARHEHGHLRPGCAPSQPKQALDATSA